MPLKKDRKYDSSMVVVVVVAAVVVEVVMRVVVALVSWTEDCRLQKQSKPQLSVVKSFEATKEQQNRYP